PKSAESNDLRKISNCRLSNARTLDHAHAKIKKTAPVIPGSTKFGKVSRDSPGFSCSRAASKEHRVTGVLRALLSLAPDLPQDPAAPAPALALPRCAAAIALPLPRLTSSADACCAAAWGVGHWPPGWPGPGPSAPQRGWG